MEGVIRAFFAHPLTGSPKTIVAAIKEMADAGLEGMAITWNDYDLGLDEYERDLLSLMVEAGLRTAADVPAPLTSTSAR